MKGITKKGLYMNSWQFLSNFGISSQTSYPSYEISNQSLLCWFALIEMLFILGVRKDSMLVFWFVIIK